MYSGPILGNLNCPTEDLRILQYCALLRLVNCRYLHLRLSRMTVTRSKCATIGGQQMPFYFQLTRGNGSLERSLVLHPAIPVSIDPVTGQPASAVLYRYSKKETDFWNVKSNEIHRFAGPERALAVCSYVGLQASYMHTCTYTNSYARFRPAITVPRSQAKVSRIVPAHCPKNQFFGLKFLTVLSRTDVTGFPAASCTQQCTAAAAVYVALTKNCLQLSFVCFNWLSVCFQIVQYISLLVCLINSDRLGSKLVAKGSF